MGMNDPDWPGDDEAALTYVGTPALHLVIESWPPGTGWRRDLRY